MNKNNDQINYQNQKERDDTMFTNDPQNKENANEISNEDVLFIQPSKAFNEYSVLGQVLADVFNPSCNEECIKDVSEIPHIIKEMSFDDGLNAFLQGFFEAYQELYDNECRYGDGSDELMNDEE